MSKKSFKGGFDSILGESLTTEEHQEIKKNNIENAKFNQKDIDKSGEVSKKITIRLNHELLKKTKDLAYWDRMTVTEIITRSLVQYISNNEHKLEEMNKK